MLCLFIVFFFFQAEDGIRDVAVTGVQTCALPISPKYLNSPDTPIFHKGKLLYNLHVAKHAMRKAERAILVEGYFDVLRPSLAGIEEVVAPLGTGLTPEQAQLVKRHAPLVILLYDSDEPGLRATFRAGDELLREGLRVSVATLP